MALIWVYFFFHVGILVAAFKQTHKIAGSSFRDESLHSTATQKQSIDSMSRGQSVKMQPSKQFKLKSNFRSNSSALMQYHQQLNMNLANDNMEDALNKCDSGAMQTNRSTQSEYAIYGSQINSNAFHTVDDESPSPSLIDGNQIDSPEMLSMAPLTIETNANKIRLTTQSTANTHQTHMGRPKTVSCKGLRRSTAQPALLRSWFGWFRPKRNATFHSPPLDHPTKCMKVQMDVNENPNGLHTNYYRAAHETTADVPTSASATAANFTDNNNLSSNDDEDISNSSLRNIDPMALKDELAAYMDEIRAREKKIANK